MCIVCRWNSGEEKLDLNIEELCCMYCTALTSIPVMPKLKKLNCIECTSLTSIPALPKLETLFCNDCTSVTNIPLCPRLIHLYCSGCTSLTNIPVLPKLEELYCDGCKWIKYCDDYNSNIKALHICQAIFKRKLTARKLEKLLPVITEIYYSPGCKGEYLALRAFQEKLPKGGETLRLHYPLKIQIEIAKIVKRKINGTEDVGMCEKESKGGTQERIRL